MCFRGVLLGACVAWLCQAASLSPLYQYAFQARTFQEATFTSTAEAVVLSGRSPRECSDQLDFTDANVSFVALALTDKGQGCFGQAAYSNGDFPIVLGTVQLGDDTFDAFEIQPPQSSAEQFVASGQQLYIRLSNTSSDYRLYLLENGVLIPMAQLKSDVTNTFVPTGHGSRRIVHSGRISGSACESFATCSGQKDLVRTWCDGVCRNLPRG